MFWISVFFVWVLERLAQPIFFYPISISGWFLLVIVFFVISDYWSVWPTLAGIIVFDLFSGMTLGVLTAALFSAGLCVFIARSFMNFRDSFISTVFLSALISFSYCLVIFWLGDFPFYGFIKTVLFVSLGVALLVVSFRYVLKSYYEIT